MSLKSNLSPSPSLVAALDALKRGDFVILVDSEDRENEGDLILAAHFADAEKVNFLIRQACGLVCLALESEQVDRLGLPLMVTDNQSPRTTAFTISIEAATGVTTGISAQDRARTIQVAADPKSSRADVVAPGHIFPLRAVPGGVRVRAGHTEGSIELCKMAGLPPAAVICEIINEDGTMARRPDLEHFSQKHNIPLVTIEDLIRSLDEISPMQETLSESEARVLDLQAGPESRLPLENGVWIAQAYRNPWTSTEHLLLKTSDSHSSHSSSAYQEGDQEEVIPLIRLHSECLTGDVFGSRRCDCGPQLTEAMNRIQSSPHSLGALLYLRNHEGRGIGLYNKMCAYSLQDQGRDTVEANVELGFKADQRDYVDAIRILKMNGWNRVRLLTNNPEKVRALQIAGIDVVERVPLVISATQENQRYLHTKMQKFHHQLGMHS
jgi:3,4-dihydroxy 2-butanone 4-phosphate synthase/GTP cyclohydrolase II